MNAQPLSLAQQRATWRAIELGLLALEPRTREHRRADAVLRVGARAAGWRSRGERALLGFGAVTTATLRRAVSPTPQR